MKIHLKLKLGIEGHRILRQGVFTVNIVSYKKDPEREAAITSYLWLKSIQREYSGRKIAIEQVLWDGADITNHVRQLKPVEMNNDLPF
ncbi:hypothetical protein [Mangrovibacillus cuniculi]|uniref:Uncharacterized protein n=1 Tax=Mangrovibacillus cuniculi TaxID=2593652 RepID=A0A7S8CBS6_9BACI|nr:hypothetical protein [Mangrovibacillus cuniculi]QPC47095.1 hypothetical protein G8O30_09010 [Mangrovibacillus cuniculi]QPC48498.1 hypothetical protein G8O30_15950 [Mangrovibacillus cuniculi]